MINIFNWLIPAIVIAMICYFTARAIIGQYFTAKEGFVKKMVHRLKGANDGKRT